MINWLMQSFQRLRSVFRRDQLDHELDAELAAHLELAIQENLQRGLPAEEARRRAEAERKRVDEDRQRAEVQARQAAAQAEEAKRTADARVEEEKKKRPAAVALATASNVTAGAVPGQHTAVAIDGNYGGLLCTFPNQPTRRACWRVDLNILNGTASASWPSRLIDKTAYLHATVDHTGAAKLTLDGWNQKAGTPLGGTMTGNVVGNHLDAEGQWANGVHIDGHWTRAP